MRGTAAEQCKDPERVTLPNSSIPRSLTIRADTLVGLFGSATSACAEAKHQGRLDKRQYVDEKRETLTLWNAPPRSIVEPPAANVVELRA
jgi:hypothetical protein